MKIALAQLDLLIGDIAGAARAISAAATDARAQGAVLMVCPELCALGGYPPRDLLERAHLVRQQWDMLRELARSLPLPTLIGCAEPLDDGPDPRIANALIAVHRGRIVATYHKRLLPVYDVFDERRYFRPGNHSRVVELAGMSIGLTICEDIWNEVGARYQQDPVAELVGRCDLLVNVSASPYHAGKPLVRQRLVADVARRLNAPVVYCNQVGGHDELLFDGGSCIAAADGSWRLCAPRWKSGVFVGDTERSTAPMVDPPAEPDASEDLYRALTLGIQDYCLKTRQTKVVLGLSGGIDSALVATLACDALGSANVIGLLMPGPYSSRGSVTDAQALAANLGIRTHDLMITRAFETLLGELDPVFADTPPGLAEENLQSRLRGTLVMAVANKLGAMALTTGNKSEIAVGYCTIYGDMNGGLAPIGDLYKGQVWALSRWINRAAGKERIPTASIDKVPSAELRENQTDQDSLPPYDVLDRILERYLERGESIEQIVAAGEDAAVVAKIARLVEVSEFKRRQSAPTLRVTPKAFGVGRRMPIARYIG